MELKIGYTKKEWEDLGLLESIPEERRDNAVEIPEVKKEFK